MYGYICPDCGCHLDPGEKMRLQGGKGARKRKGNKVSKDAESREKRSNED